MPRPLIAALCLGGLLVLVLPVNVHVIRAGDSAAGWAVHSVTPTLALPAAGHVMRSGAFADVGAGAADLLRPLPAQVTHSPSIVIGKGIEGLPAPVAAMRAAILDAARSGIVEEMREPIEMSEIKPEFGPSVDTDPIAYWKKISVDGEGREILAALAGILDMGWARRPVSDAGKGRAMYVWPYLAELPMQNLSADQQADLQRLMPQPEVDVARKSGRYTNWTLGIAEDGTWHYFVRGQ